MEKYIFTSSSMIDWTHMKIGWWFPFLHLNIDHFYLQIMVEVYKTQKIDKKMVGEDTMHYIKMDITNTSSTNDEL
jgi:hypothetical protein